MSHNRAKYYEWEKMFKGAANHRRMEMLALLSKKSALSTEDISTSLGVNYHTGARHLRRLVRSGLVYAKRDGGNLSHFLSPLGKAILTFAQKCK
jgi:predicted transcriptional regulator